MKQAITIPEILDLRKDLPMPVGLVPTMGYLHEGHLSLVRAARQSCASVVATIFVNPTQFRPTEDLEKYPRDLQRDLELLTSESVDLVWMPTPEEMYPPGFQTWVTVDQITRTLEGSFRQGHFRGVCTIVAKLLNVVRPDIAFFGQKDAQQALVIQRMITDLNFGTKVKVCPTIREPDGLAKSSRNIFLNPQQRTAASVIHRALIAAQKAFNEECIIAEQLRQIMMETLSSEPIIQIEYVSCSDPNTLIEISGQINDPALLSMAVKLGDVRLIDNIIIGGLIDASCD